MEDNFYKPKDGGKFRILPPLQVWANPSIIRKIYSKEIREVTDLNAGKDLVIGFASKVKRYSN